jgi:hypothetical protein
MNNQIFKKFNSKFIKYSIALAAITILFLVPYVKFFPYVGSFPSENLSDALPGSHFSNTLCISDTILNQSTSTQQAKIVNSKLLTDAPALKILRPTDFQADIFENSNSIYYLGNREAIIALDIVDTADINMLKAQALQGVFSPRDLEIFLGDATAYYAPCNAPRVDTGVAEGYWASKGASVLHHWAHLYESNLSGRVHSQYGYLVSWIAHKTLDWNSAQGPTNFVRLAWVIYAVCGLAYIAIFIYMFHEHPQLALAALLIKLFFLSNIGSFMLVLAPGYHWFRELVILAVPMIVLVSVHHYSVTKVMHRAFLLIATGILLAVCYLVDPVFFLIAIFSAIFSWLWNNWHIISDYHKQNRIQLVFISSIVIAVLIGVALFQYSNLQYVADKLLNASIDFGKYSKRVVLTCFIALLFLIFARPLRNRFLAGYFSFVTLLLSLYYFITPDSFHFYKFAEYSVPFWVVAIAFLQKRYSTWFKTHFYAIQPKLYRSLPLGFILLASITLSNFTSLPISWEFRLTDSSGEPYFKSSTYNINNRLIKADISEKLASHLRSFPNSASADFILSPFDKYLAFIYDRSNGLGTPDLIASLDTNEKMKNALERISQHSSSPYILLDRSILHVDTRLGIKQNNPVLGLQHAASKLNLKARLRAAELATNILSLCTVTYKDKAEMGWDILRCNFK